MAKEGRPASVPPRSRQACTRGRLRRNRNLLRSKLKSKTASAKWIQRASARPRTAESRSHLRRRKKNLGIEFKKQPVKGKRSPSRSSVSRLDLIRLWQRRAPERQRFHACPTASKARQRLGRDPPA